MRLWGAEVRLGLVHVGRVWGRAVGIGEIVIEDSVDVLGGFGRGGGGGCSGRPVVEGLRGEGGGGGGMLDCGGGHGGRGGDSQG